MPRSVTTWLIAIVVILVIWAAFGAAIDIDFWDILWIGFVIGWLCIWIASFVDIFKRADLGTAKKVIWAAVVFLLPYVGTIVYIIARPPSGNIEYRA